MRSSGLIKKCYQCQRDFSLENFCKNKSKPDGLADNCKQCKSAADREYQAKSKDKIKIRRHQYYLKNKDEITEKVNLYIKNNRVKHNAWGTKAKNKLKNEVLSHYCDDGAVCKMCGEDELGVLSIDHIDGNGAEHRRQIFGNNRTCGYNFYRWLKRNNYPDGFQVLCFSCQYRKRLIEMRPKNPSSKQIARAEYVRSIKMECLGHYGGLVCSCGESDIEVLTLDHVNDDGAEHRRETNTGGFNFYMLLRRTGFPNDPPLQVKCLNCNIRKRNEKYAEGKN